MIPLNNEQHSFAVFCENCRGFVSLALTEKMRMCEYCCHLHLAFASLPCIGIKLHVQEKGKWKPGFYNITVSCSFIFQLGSDLGVSNPSMKSMKAVMRIMAVVAIPFTAQFPAVSVAIDTLLLNQKVTIHLKSNSPPDHSIAIKRLYFIWCII